MHKNLKDSNNRNQKQRNTSDLHPHNENDRTSRSFDGGQSDFDNNSLRWWFIEFSFAWCGPLLIIVKIDHREPSSVEEPHVSEDAERDRTYVVPKCENGHCPKLSL